MPDPMTRDYTLVNARVLRPGGRFDVGSVRIRDGVIREVRAGAPAGVTGDLVAAEAPRTIDLGGRILAPGFVDTHVHGALGHNVMSGAPASLEIIGRRLAGAGVTSFVATTATTSYDRVLAAVAALADRTGPTERGGPELLGVHLEGPFLSPSFRGVHQEEHLAEPSPEKIDALLGAASGRLRIVTMAPELPHAESAVRRLVEAGTRVSVGHTSATFAQTAAAVGWGATRATHLFNAMPPIHHRAPGPVPALLSDDRVFVEIVADGVHLAPELIAVLATSPGITDRLMFVSDGTDVAGLPDGDHRRWDGTEVLVRDGRSTTLAGGIAGSTSTLLDAVGLARAHGVPLETALDAASRNPARSLGLSDRGEISVGRRADLIVVDDGDGVAIEHTIIGGQWERRGER